MKARINAPRIGLGQPVDRVVREVQEELGVTPIGVEPRGVLSVQFVEGLSIHCEVFVASDCLGEPRETEEATPQWTPVTAIPYDRMWADDYMWLPLLLAGKRFEGRFLFDGEQLLAHELKVTSDEDHF